MYIDTSALVKLYVEEPDSEACEAVVAGTTLVSSRLLLCEFRSALLGKISKNNVTDEAGSRIWGEFVKDIAASKIRLIPINDLLVQEAMILLSELHPNARLRTLDALHLATYLSIETCPIFTKDRRMIDAATLMGLPLAG
jgi:predicted nucleic acid-binding protein